VVLVGWPPRDFGNVSLPLGRGSDVFEKAMSVFYARMTPGVVERPAGWARVVPLFEPQYQTRVLVEKPVNTPWGASKGGSVHEDRIWLFFCPA
jgi:hypothetical protein